MGNTLISLLDHEISVIKEVGVGHFSSFSLIRVSRDQHISLLNFYCNKESLFFDDGGHSPPSAPLPRRSPASPAPPAIKPTLLLGSVKQHAVSTRMEPPERPTPEPPEPSMPEPPEPPERPTPEPPTPEPPEPKCCEKKRAFCFDCRGCTHTCRCNGRTPTAKRERGQRGKAAANVAKTSGVFLPPRNLDSKYVEAPDSSASSDEEKASRLETESPEEVAGKYMKLAEEKTVPVRDWSQRTCRREWKSVIQPILQTLGSAYGSSASELLNKMYKEVPSARPHLVSREKEEILAQAVGETVIDALRVAPSQKLRDELLPFVVGAEGSNFETLQGIFPWLTEWHYRQAHNRVVTGETNGEKGPSYRVKLTQEQLDTIVMFCLRPDNVQDVAYGVNEYKLDSGGSFIVPDFIRLQIRSRLFDKFKGEFGQEYVSSSSFYKVANLICKRDLSSFAGLDNIDVDGKRAIDGLLGFMADAKTKYSEYWGQELLEKYEQVQLDLNDSKKCLRRHLVDNVQDESTYATHCINHSLTDENMQDGNCNCNHDHVNCPICDKLILSVCFCEALLNKIVGAQGIDQQEKAMYKTEVNGYVEDALSWMAHIVRSCVQGKVRPAILGTMKRHQCYIIVDWAMKWVSRYYREKMEEWYGKAGMHWHEAVVFYKTSDDESDVQMMSITHIAEESKQNADQVFYLICDILRKSKERLPHLTEAYLQSDRAGCYHCKELITRLALAETALDIVEINFSESQDGKDACDRNIAVKKGGVMRFVKRGGNASSAPELIEAIKSETVLSGEHHCIGYKPYDAASHSSLKMRSTKATEKFSKLSQITFIRGDDNKVKSLAVREQYQVGPTRFIPMSQFVTPENSPSEVPTAFARISDDKIGSPTRAASPTKRTYKKRSPDKKTQAEMMKALSSSQEPVPSSQEQPPSQEPSSSSSQQPSSSSSQQPSSSSSQDPSLPSQESDASPDEQSGPPYICSLCNRAYFKLGFFTKHMSANIHVAPAKNKSLKDRVGATLQAQLGECVVLSSTHVRRKRSADEISRGEEKDEEQCEPLRRKRGWARRGDRGSNVRFSDRVKAFIRKLFYDGIDENGKTDQAKKVSPEKARKLLKEKVAAEGWNPETELLTEKQIASLFSREKQQLQKQSYQCWTALQNSRVQQEQVQNSLMAREQVSAAVVSENPAEIEIIIDTGDGDDDNNNN